MTTVFCKSKMKLAKQTWKLQKKYLYCGPDRNLRQEVFGQNFKMYRNRLRTRGGSDFHESWNSEFQNPEILSLHSIKVFFHFNHQCKSILIPWLPIFQVKNDNKVILLPKKPTFFKSVTSWEGRECFSTHCYFASHSMNSETGDILEAGC